MLEDFISMIVLFKIHIRRCETSLLPKPVYMFVSVITSLLDQCCSQQFVVNNLFLRCCTLMFHYFYFRYVSIMLLLLRYFKLFMFLSLFCIPYHRYCIISCLIESSLELYVTI